jgi:hypothetical protein
MTAGDQTHRRITPAKPSPINLVAGQSNGNTRALDINSIIQIATGRGRLMSKATIPLNPFDLIADDVARMIDDVTPAGAFAVGRKALEALIAEHPESATQVAGELRNVADELKIFAAIGNGRAIAERLQRLANDLRGRLGRPNVYVPMPPRPSAFPAPRPERYPGGIADPRTYPWLDSTGSPRKQG